MTKILSRKPQDRDDTGTQGEGWGWGYKPDWLCLGPLFFKLPCGGIESRSQTLGQPWQAVPVQRRDGLPVRGETFGNETGHGRVQSGKELWFHYSAVSQPCNVEHPPCERGAACVSGKRTLL